MLLTDDQRKAIMGWLEVIKGGKEMIKKVNVRFGGARGGAEGGYLLLVILYRMTRVWISTITNGFSLLAATASSLPPTLEAALSILSSDFFIPIILEDQDCFRRRSNGWEVLLELIPDKEVRTRLEEKWGREAEMEMEDDEDEDEKRPGGKTRSEDRWDDLKKEIKGVPKGTPRRVRFPTPNSQLFSTLA
jgi:DNA primase small subunit